MLDFFVLAVVVLAAAESRTLSIAESSNLNRLIGDVARCARAPAVALALVRDGQIVYTNGFGTANQQEKKQANSRTIFCLGDITQTFTATLLAKLLDEHQNYTWDTPVREILGASVNFGNRFRNDYLSLRDILSMRTGLSNMDIIVTANAMDRLRLISNLRFTPEVGSFREKHTHNDLLFVLAEEVLRHIGRDTWQKLIQDNILTPLGMKETYFVHTDAKEQANLAQPVMSYHGRPMAIPMESMAGQELVAAGTSICSTANDMAKWLLFNLNNGVTQDGGQLLPPGVLEEVYQAQTIRSDHGDVVTEGFSQPHVQVANTREANTLGWIRGNYQGYSVLSQDGSLTGWQSLLSVIQSKKIGVFTAFTGDSGRRAYAVKTLVSNYAMDILINGQPWFGLQHFCHLVDEMVRMSNDANSATKHEMTHQPDSKRPLTDYQGLYRNLAFGDIRVWLNESLRLKYGDLGEYILRPSNTEHVFFMEAVPGTLWYTTHVDVFRDLPSFVYFNSTPYSDERIEIAKIPSFDGTTDPVFNKRVRVPPSYEEAREGCVISGGAATTWSLFSLIVCILVRFS